MNLPDRQRRAKWAPFSAAAVAREVAAHALLLAFAWYGGLGYFGTVLVLTAEALLIIALSIFLYPQRGLARHLWDIVKSSAFALFLLAFVAFTYGVATQDEAEVVVAALRGAFDWTLLAWSLGFAAAHQLVMLVHARTTPDPRRSWARSALTQGAVTYLALFFLVFVAAFVGPFAVSGARSFWPDVDADHVLALLAVLVRLALALVMAHIPEHELDQMAKNPYVD